MWGEYWYITVVFSQKELGISITKVEGTYILFETTESCVIIKKTKYKKYVGNLISNRHFFTDRKKVKWFQGMKKIKSIVLKSFNKSEKIGWHLLSYPKTRFQNEGLIFIQIYFCDLNFHPALVKIGSEIDISQHILRTIYMFCFYTL